MTMLITRRRPTAVSKLPITVLIITLAALTVSAATARDVSNAQPLLHQQQPQEQLLDADSSSSNTAAGGAAQCLYEIVVKTAAVEGAGTDARISLTLSTADGRSVLAVEDLESWGWLGSDYDYFEPGDLDIFGAGQECLPAMPCRMLLESDGSSDKPDWKPSMVEIIQITTKLSVSVRKFFLDQWLSAAKAPNQLFVYQDLCANDQAASSSA